MRALLFGLALTLLAGCAGPNIHLQRMQFSGEQIAFPNNYQDEAARVVKEKRGDLKSSTVSYPLPTLGASAFSPRRWYACIRGLPAPPPSTRTPNLEAAVTNLVSPPQGIFDTILVFSEHGVRATVRSGYDSPLCRDAKFGPITAEFPNSPF
ncbi:hypothetical protein [Devosia sp. 2618]|uniref:hypothetical protein n=1 Tax=Devosia sp. 2618 TaxID=3156454 RepID=UPI003394A0FA